MMRFLCIVAVWACASAEMANWEKQGETMDEQVLASPAHWTEAQIFEHNTNPKSTWTAGHNIIFEHASLAEAKIRMGTKQDKEGKHTLPYKAPEKIVELPTEFDWRTDPRAAKCPSIKEIRDQSNCGSCWAFGSVEAMTDRICINSTGADTTRLSAQDVTSCDVLGDMGCNGGIPSTVYTYYRTFGIVDGGKYGDKSMCWSYQLAPCAHHTNSTKYPACPEPKGTPGCKRKCVDDQKSWEGSKKRGMGGYSVCQQGAANSACADAMMQEIYQNGPITGMFFVKQSFLSYKSGVYEAKLFEPMLGGHAIKIMGFGTENNVPYWLVANSWNEDWGDHGYFKIKRGVDECQIENPIINGGPVAGMPKASIHEFQV